MIFSRIALLVLPVIAAATAVPRNNVKNKNSNNNNSGGNSNTCNQGTSQFCCNNLQSANTFSQSDKTLLGLFGVNTDALIGQVGLACNPVSGGNAGCNVQSVCCQNSQGTGIIVNNCTPIMV